MTGWLFEPLPRVAPRPGAFLQPVRDFLEERGFETAVQEREGASSDDARERRLDGVVCAKKCRWNSRHQTSSNHTYINSMRRLWACFFCRRALAPDMKWKSCVATASRPYLCECHVLPSLLAVELEHVPIADLPHGFLDGLGSRGKFSSNRQTNGPNGKVSSGGCGCPVFFGR